MRIHRGIAQNGFGVAAQATGRQGEGVACLGALVQVQGEALAGAFDDVGLFAIEAGGLEVDVSPDVGGRGAHGGAIALDHGKLFGGVEFDAEVARCAQCRRQVKVVYFVMHVLTIIWGCSHRMTYTSSY